MNRDTLKGQWKQIQGDVKTRWGKLTDDELTQVSGNFDKLVGKIQERYGYQREQAEREINDFLDKHPEPAGSLGKSS
jgi:uncharacterized protein YjbJ (UPF0337 family)